MPVMLRLNGYKFFFYSNKGNSREPTHIHVRTLRELTKIVEQNQMLFMEAWNDYFS